VQDDSRSFRHFSSANVSGVGRRTRCG
jgi:hypothetical protein